MSSSIRWHRITYLGDDGDPYLSYRNDERDWVAWSIDRVPQGKSRHEYQVRYHNDKIGGLQPSLDAAKAVVERSGRDAYDPVRLHGKVQVEFETSVTSGYVKQDNGGSRVLVRMKTPDGPRVGRWVVAYHGHSYERWIERAKLKQW